MAGAMDGAQRNERLKRFSGGRSNSSQLPHSRRLRAGDAARRAASEDRAAEAREVDGALYLVESRRRAMAKGKGDPTISPPPVPFGKKGAIKATEIEPPPVPKPIAASLSKNPKKPTS